MEKALKIMLLTLAILLFAIPFTSAQSDISSYNTDIKIIENKALVSQNIIFDDIQENGFSIVLPKDAQISDFYIDNQAVVPAVQETKIGKILNIENCQKVSIKFISSQLLDRAKKTYLTYDISIPAKTQELSVTLTLPEQAVLDTQTSAYPTPNEKTTDGQKITLVWNKQNMDENFPIFIIFREKSKTNVVVILGTTLIILIVLIVVVKYLTTKKKNVVPKKKPKSKVKKEPKLYLLQSEQKVVDVLKKNKKEMWQKQIQVKTGFSKAKLSRTIRNLEARGIIKRIPLGNTNKIKLK